MRRAAFLLASAFCIAVFGSSVSAQTTYVWNQTGTASYTTSTNWTPTRTTPATNDVLLFNNGATTTVTGVPTQTIGQLSVSAGTNVTLQAAANPSTLTIGGGGGTDLIVNAGTQLNISSGNALNLTVATGATASILGSMSVAGAAHRFTSTDASSITFQNGATFTADTGFTGNAFGTAALHSVSFASGSIYAQVTGGNPFGASAPQSV
ncbi:MAG TPA: hypothetical protein VFZ44_11450, partial [Pyrinomonadaceae bacterium]